MKRILFCCQGLWIGGTEKTMIEALKAIDYSKYTVDLYVRNNYTALLEQVPSEVNVKINETSLNCLQQFVVNIIKSLSAVPIHFRFVNVNNKMSSLLTKTINYMKRSNERREYFKGKKQYDVAIAYDMAKECALFVRDCVDAKKRITFYHDSKLSFAKARIYKTFDQIVCVNDSVADELKTDFPELSPKTIGIENYLSPETVLKRLDEENKEKDCELTLTTCGRIWQTKRYNIAVEVAKILLERGVDFHWYFVGNGEQRAYIEDLIAGYNLENNITITGFIENPYVYTNACDIYVHTCAVEAHATTMVEAMIMKKPIIATDSIAARYFSKQYGCCEVTDSNPQTIADCILNMHYNEADKDRYKEIYYKIDWNKIHDKYVRNINNLLDI